MGSLLSSHEDLVHIRGWTKKQISTVLETVRKQGARHYLEKDFFTRYIGGRHNEAVTIFNDMDTDFDGKVDIFEALTMLILWSGTAWDEKEEMFFNLYDLMGKGRLSVNEVMLMGTVMLRTLKKFVQLPDEISSFEQILSEEPQSLPPSGLDMDQFRDWVSKQKRMQDLRQFIEDHTARAKAAMKANQMQLRCTMAEKHTHRLFLRVSQLNEALPVFANVCSDHVNTLGRRKRWDFTMQTVRTLIWNIQQEAESMQQHVTDLHSSLKEAEESSEMTTLINPHSRFWQEQVLTELETKKVKTAKEFKDLTHHIWHLIELTEQGELENQEQQQPQQQLLQPLQLEVDPSELLGYVNVFDEERQGSPSKVGEQRAIMKEVHHKLMADISENGPLYVRSLGTGTAIADVTPGSGAAGGEQAITKPDQSDQQTTRSLQLARSHDVGYAAPMGGANPDNAVLVAVADFEPPESHQSQVLKLAVGDLIKVLGQDGRGWWFGRKENGHEGWFPPSYVQVKPAHLRQPGQPLVAA